MQHSGHGEHERIGRKRRYGAALVLFATALLPLVLAAPSTPAAPLDQVCSPRPAVSVSGPVQDGSGRLRVTVSAQSTASTPNNQLRSLRFFADGQVPAPNGVIDVDDHNQFGRLPPFTLDLLSPRSQQTFFIRPQVADRAITIQLEVVDNCPTPWRTFVGAGVTALPAATATLVPAASPTPMPTPGASPTPPPIAGIPRCAHDDRVWHGLVERASNGSILCTYGHEHKDDPRVLDGLFGPLSYGTIGVPWAALNAAGNPENHRTFGWAVVQVSTCLTPNGRAGLTAMRVQTHVGYNGATSRDHSFHLQAQTCVPGDPVAGRLSVGGHLDFGFLYIDSPQCLEQRVALQSDIIRPLLNLSLRRLHAGYPTCPRVDMTWYGANGAISNGAPRVLVNLGVRREDWGQIDPASPSTLHLTDPNNANGSWQEPAHLVSVFVPDEWDALDGVLDGRVTFQGFTDRWGNLVGPCAPEGMDCVPLWLDRVRTGMEYQFRADAAGIGPREYDVRVNGQSLIEYPN